MAFDKTLPIEGALAPTYNNIMRADKVALEAALNAYMYFVTGGTQTGQPRQGQARPYYQASAPATRLDGDYFDSTDYGTPWIDSDNGKLYFLTSADGAGTDVWVLASTEIIATLLAAARVFASTLKSTGDFTVGANKVVITAANGNTAVAGTLSVTGVATVAKGSLLASSDPPTTDPMLTPKKYVNDEDLADHPAYTGGESHIDGSGLITKQGFESVSTSVVVSFDDAFPDTLKTIQLTTVSSIADFSDYQVDDGSYSKTGFTAHVDAITNLSGFFWTAMGF